MNHEEFIDELLKYGITVKWKSEYTCTGSSWSLHINKQTVDIQHLSLFGFECRGTYAQNMRTNKVKFNETDIINAIKYSLKRSQESINNMNKDLNYFDILDYLIEYETTKQVEKSSIQRVLKIIKEDFNIMYRKKNQ